MFENLSITNYSDKRCSPLFSITRLPREEAFSKAKELSHHASECFTSFSRFTVNDFPGYYDKRIRTEKWLYDSFLSLGGKPVNAHPLYFVLGESFYLTNWFEKGVVTQIQLDRIDSGDISFTYGDSMSMMDSPERVNLFDKESLLIFLKEESDDIPSFLNDLNRKNRYIEVQLWKDDYVKDFIDHSSKESKGCDYNRSL